MASVESIYFFADAFFALKKNKIYIFGDFSYDKVRLKGYNDSSNKKATKINDIKGLEEYKKNYCSYGARTFLLKKIK